MAYTGPQILFTGQPAGGDFQASILIGPSAGNEVTPITGQENTHIPISPKRTSKLLFLQFALNLNLH